MTLRGVKSASSASLQSLPLIERLVSFDTTSRESNLGLIEWVRDYLEGFGVATRLTYDADRRKANLFAQVGEGPKPGIVLSGHTDVVPVDGQDWHSDPFVASVQGDRIVGRGTSDMKSFIAISLAMTPKFLAAQLQAPVYLALSYDEEVGCLGVRGLLEDLAAAGIRPGGCVVGEPTGMELVVANKGKRSYRCSVRGREAHSSLTPQGVNAIEYAARLIVHLRQMADRFRDSEKRDAAFDVPFTTLQTGVVSGGTAVNIVPGACDFEFELRHLPGVDPDTIEQDIRAFVAGTLLAEMRSVDPRASFEIQTLSEIPGLANPDGSAMVRLAQQLARRDAESQALRKVAYATEAGLFERSGIPAIILGPGSIDQAHKPDEFIALAQIAACERFMERLTETLCR